MSSMTPMTYHSACDSAAYFHHQTELIQSDLLWVRDNLRSSEQMRTFSNGIYERIDQCRHFITSPVQLDDEDDEDLTTIVDEITFLSDTLKHNVRTYCHFEIFQKIVLEKLEIVRSVAPRVLPLQVLLSDQLLEIEKRISDTDWIAKNLDTDEKVKLFMSSFLQLLELNSQHLILGSLPLGEAPVLIIQRISTALPTDEIYAIFQREVMHQLPFLEEKGKKYKRDKFARELPEQQEEVKALQREVTELRTKLDAPGADSNLKDLEAQSSNRLFLRLIGLHELEKEASFHT